MAGVASMATAIADKTTSLLISFLLMLRKAKTFWPRFAEMGEARRTSKETNGVAPMLVVRNGNARHPGRLLRD
jgi:hypothetical protein